MPCSFRGSSASVGVTDCTRTAIFFVLYFLEFCDKMKNDRLVGSTKDRCHNRFLTRVNAINCSDMEEAWISYN